MSGHIVKKSLFVSAIILALVFTWRTAVSSAKPSPVPDGFTVAPVLQQLSLKPGQTTLNFTAGISNNTSNAVVVKLSAIDFKPLNQTGAIQLLTTPKLQQNNPNGLANNISFLLPEFALQPHGSQLVNVTVNNADKLSVGGHYTDIVFTVVGVTAPGGHNSVNINQAISSLVFLSTSSGGTQSLSLQYTDISSNLINFPKLITAVIADTGNTQTVPQGVIQIINSGNQIIAQTQINTSSNLILPQSNRLFSFPIVLANAKLNTGYYTLKFYYKTPDQSGYHLYQKKFLYISQEAIYLFVAIIVLLLILIVQRKRNRPRVV